MKKYKFIYILLALNMLLFSCAAEDTAPEDPIISGVEKIEIQHPSYDLTFSSAVAAASNTFQYDAPDSVSYLIIAIFTGPISVSGETVNTSNLYAGLNTDLGVGTSTTPMSSMLLYQSGTQEFSGSIPASTNNYYWAILGYDSNYNLVAASPEWKNRITWP